jgi:hypothetical protein
MLKLNFLTRPDQWAGVVNAIASNRACRSPDNRPALAASRAAHRRAVETNGPWPNNCCSWPAEVLVGV